ncbi:MAG TPA: hypothetical protein VNZ66_08030 [Aeromicrobium sp.]|nr:hypothetical protein [Aeromicrobium sp.]
MSEHSASLADKLLDAHVRFTIAALTGAERDGHVADVVDELLDAGESITLRQLLDATEVVRVVQRVLSTVPPSSVAERLALGAADVLHAGPTEPFTAADLISRDDVARVVDELIAARPVIERVLDEIVESPLIASVVSRFVARLVGDVLGSGRTAAAKVPGVGGLLGTASKVVGVGASGVEQLLGGTAGKGAQIAARRLNRVAVDTLQDPQFKEAFLQLWDQRSGTRVRGLSRIASSQDTRRTVGLLHDVAVEALGSAPVADLAAQLVATVFDVYGDTPVTSVVEGLGITRADLVTDAQHAAATIVTAAAVDGSLERLVRGRLEPFYRSTEFSAALQ